MWFCSRLSDSKAQPPPPPDSSTNIWPQEPTNQEECPNVPDIFHVPLLNLLHPAFCPKMLTRMKHTQRLSTLWSQAGSSQRRQRDISRWKEKAAWLWFSAPKVTPVRLSIQQSLWDLVTCPPLVSGAQSWYQLHFWWPKDPALSIVVSVHLTTLLKLSPMTVPPVSCRDPGWYTKKQKGHRCSNGYWRNTLGALSFHNGSFQKGKTKNSHHYREMETNCTCHPLFQNTAWSGDPEWTHDVTWEQESG